MITEKSALLTKCPLLDVPGAKWDDPFCEGALCPQWERAKHDLTTGPPYYGDCYWLERRRRHDERKQREG